MDFRPRLPNVLAGIIVLFGMWLLGIIAMINTHIAADLPCNARGTQPCFLYLLGDARLFLFALAFGVLAYMVASLLLKGGK